MKINWKRIVIAAIWSELLIAAIYFPARLNLDGGPAFLTIAMLNFFVWMFLGGLWVARKIDSHILLHGALVGLFANIIWFFLGPMVMPDTPLWRGFVYAITTIISPFKILPAMVGAYVGGRQRKKLLSTHVSKL